MAELSEAQDADEVRRLVRVLLEKTLPAGWAGMGALEEAELPAFRSWWRSVLRETRLLAPGWPREYGGGGLDHVAESVVHEEFVRAGVPPYVDNNDMLGVILIGPTILNWGTPEQKEFFIPRTISGEIRWAQGFSEPEAGSDLFNLRTRARHSGAEWVVDGHKMWQTAGTTANWLFALVRTDLDAVGGKGISMMLIPLEQPGITVSGIRSMTGHEEFAEVLFTDAVVDESGVLGGVNNGARVAMSLLGLERGAGGVPLTVANVLELDRLVELARHHGRDRDVAFRRRLAEARVRITVMESFAHLVRDEGGDGPAAHASIMKLLVSRYRQWSTELAADILGPEVAVLEGAGGVDTLQAQPRGVDAVSPRAWLLDLLRARPGTIYGGSNEVQRNLIGEGLLGLPREPRPQRPVSRKNEAEVSS